MERVGLLGARADNGGLATLTREFARHLRPERVLGVDLADRGRGPARWETFPGRVIVNVGMDHELDAGLVRSFCRGLDVVYAAETLYRADVAEIARSVDCRVVLHAMPELWRADHSPPDVVLAPTPWRLDLLPAASVFPVPVARDRLPFRLRTGIETFLHVTGAAHMDRNGTRLLGMALPFVTRTCRLVVTGEQRAVLSEGWNGNVFVEHRDPVDSYWMGYEGDCLLLPRRFAGLSLPWQEASSLGMPVVMLDAPPQDALVPPACLVPAAPIRQLATPGGRVDVFGCDPRVLAAKMDELLGSPETVESLSRSAGAFAESISWDRMRGSYVDLLTVVGRTAPEASSVALEPI